MYNMVKYALKVSCAVENLNQLSTSGQDFEWNLKVIYLFRKRLNCRTQASHTWCIQGKQSKSGKKVKDLPLLFAGHGFIKMRGLDEVGTVKTKKEMAFGDGVLLSPGCRGLLTWKFVDELAMKPICSTTSRDCNEADPSWHAICENKKIKGKHGPGTFNFQMKCKFCFNNATVDVVKGSIKPLRTNDNNLIDNQLAVIFDCRGMEPVAFDPQGTWIAKSDETNTQFDDVEFGAEEVSWAGYDEKGKCPVIIDNFKSTFERLK